MVSLLRIALVAVLCLVTTACTATYPTQPTKAQPVGLYIAYTGPKGRTAPRVPGFAIVNTYGFIAYTIDADGAYERVTDRISWSSSDDGVVRAQAGVTTAGVKQYTAVAPGEASVVARFQGLEAIAPVIVIANDVITRTPRIDLTWTGANTIGASSKASALLRTPSGTSQDISNFASWTSSDPEVAAVTAGGSIKALRTGTTIITANVDGMVDWFWFSVIPAS